jgi:hypothetical protein
MLSTGVTRAGGLPACAITTSSPASALIEQRGELPLRFDDVDLNRLRFNLCSVTDPAPVGLMVN